MGQQANRDAINFFSKVAVQRQNAAASIMIAAFTLYHSGAVQEWYNRYKKLLGHYQHFDMKVNKINGLACLKPFWDPWDRKTLGQMGHSGRLGHLGHMGQPGHPGQYLLHKVFNLRQKNVKLSVLFIAICFGE